MRPRPGRSPMTAARPARGRRSLALLGLAAALALALPPGAPAAAEGRVRFLSDGLPDGADAFNVLTQGELENCVLLEREVNAAAGSIRAEETLVGTRRAELEGLLLDIDAQAGRVDRASAAAVRRHNKLIVHQQGLAVEFNARLPAHNARVGRHNARVDLFNADCAMRHFYAADMRTVRARLLLD